MELHLDPEQTVVLRDLLGSALRDLRFEIADTDNARYKAGLRAREGIYGSLLERLQAEVPAPEP